MGARDLDSDGRLPMSGKEYLDFQRICACGDAYERGMDRLEYRASISPDKNMLKRMRTIRTLINKVEQGLFDTIPRKKQRIVYDEIKRSTVRVEVTSPGLPQHQNTEYTTVPVESLEWLINRTLQWECLCCEKEGKDQKTCPFRKRLESMYLFEIEELKKGECPFATMGLLNIRNEKEGDGSKKPV